MSSMSDLHRVADEYQEKAEEYYQKAENVVGNESARRVNYGRAAQYNLCAERVRLQLYRRQPLDKLRNSAYFVRKWALRAHWQLLSVSPDVVALEERHLRLVVKTFHRYGDLGFVPEPYYEKAVRTMSSIYGAVIETRYNEAIDAGDWDSAMSQLKNGLKILKGVPKIAPPLKICRIKTESQKHILLVRKELAKPSRQRDLSRVAEEYEKAAGRTDPKREIAKHLLKTDGELNSYYHKNHRMNMFRYHAFALLGRTDVPERPLERLTKALECLESASNELEQASALRHDPYLASVSTLIEYWRSILIARCEQLKAAEAQSPKGLKVARSSIDRALELAKICEDQGRDDIHFPNRFYTIGHLELEHKWLAAFGAVLDSDFQRAEAHLESYVDGFPLQYHESWFHSNALVRLFAVKVLATLERAQYEPADTAYQQLRSLVRQEPCGAAAIEIEDWTRFALRGNDPSTAARQVANFFPIDARGKDLQPPTDQKRLEAHLQSLPPLIYESMTANTYPGDSDFSGSWKALLGILIDYYDLEDANSPLMDWLQGRRLEDLVKSVLSRSVSQGLLRRENREAIRSFSSRPKNKWRSEERIVALIALAKSAPLLVQVNKDPDEASDESGVVWWSAWPQWSRQKRFRIHIGSRDPRRFEGGGRWYLPPGWRKGTRRTVQVSDIDRVKSSRIKIEEIRTREDVARQEKKASYHFEHIVTQYILPLLSDEQELTTEDEYGLPETDVLIKGKVSILVGEIKSTSLAQLRSDDARRAIKQLQERSDGLNDEKMYNDWRVLITNARAVPRNVLDWLDSSARNAVWVATLDVDPDEFVESPHEARITDMSVLTLCKDGELYPRQLNREYFRELSER